MKFQKESFLAFLQSLKQGSVLIVAAIKKSTEDQNTANAEILDATKKAQEKLDEIAGKEIDLRALESISQNIEKSKNTLEKIKTAVEEKPSGEITISTPVKLEKPSWLSELKTPLSPIVEGFASLISSLSGIKSIIEQIEKREIKLPLSKDGRIMVEVDRIGGGSGNRPPANTIKNGMTPLSGEGVNGTVALASANNWYAVPSTVPTSDYVLVVSIENALGDIRFGFSGSGTPSATNGNLAPGLMELKLAAGEIVYFASSTAGDDVNWTTKVI